MIKTFYRNYEIITNRDTDGVYYEIKGTDLVFELMADAIAWVNNRASLVGRRYLGTSHNTFVGFGTIAVVAHVENNGFLACYLEVNNGSLEAHECGGLLGNNKKGIWLLHKDLNYLTSNHFNLADTRYWKEI
jgi:hypothetical protein